MISLSRKEKALLKSLAQKYSLELLLLFGSQTKDKKYLHFESDFDFAYLSKKELNLKDESKLIYDLSLIFKTEKIELVNLKKAGPLLLREIFASSQILFCQDIKKYLGYKIYSFKKYIEAKPLFELLEKSIKEFLETHGK